MTQVTEVAPSSVLDRTSSLPGNRRPVNLRSLLLGFAGVSFVCSLTAYNDYVLHNTYMVGNYLPVGCCCSSWSS
jgi:hypothetical protein